MSVSNQKKSFNVKIESGILKDFMKNYIETYKDLTSNDFAFPKNINKPGGLDKAAAVIYLIAEKSLMFFNKLKGKRWFILPDRDNNFYDILSNLNNLNDSKLKNYLLASLDLAAKTFDHCQKVAKDKITNRKYGKTCALITETIETYLKQDSAIESFIEIFDKMKSDFESVANKYDNEINSMLQAASISAANTANELKLKKETRKKEEKKEEKKDNRPSSLAGGYKKKPKKKVSRKKVSRKKVSGKKVSGKKVSRKKVSRKKVSGKKVSKKKVSKKKVSKTPMKSTVTRDGKKYVVRTGDRGGKYIMKNKVKVYL